MKKTVVRTTNNPINITDFEFKIPKCARSVPQFMAKLKCFIFILFYISPNNTPSHNIVSTFIHKIQNTRNQYEGVVLNSERTVTIKIARLSQ